MLVIGLSGGICCGKSSVTQICQDLGAYILNADLLGHQAYSHGTDCYHEIIETFGSSVVEPTDGSINRRALGTIVFNDERQMKLLNQIVWPRIRTMIEMKLHQMQEEEGSEDKVVVLEAAILIEAGWHDLVDEIWVIDSERSLSLPFLVLTPLPALFCSALRSLVIDRLMKRNNLSQEECEKRISSQMPFEERRAHARRVITNSGTKEELADQVRDSWLAAMEMRQRK
jgi:dephospho-CoA kinase